MLKTVKLELQTGACTTFCAVYQRGFFYRSHFTGHDYRSLFCGLVTKSKNSSFCLKYILVSDQSFTLWPVKCDLLKSIICIHCKSLLKQTIHRGVNLWRFQIWRSVFLCQFPLLNSPYSHHIHYIWHTKCKYQCTYSTKQRQLSTNIKHNRLLGENWKRKQ